MSQPKKSELLIAKQSAIRALNQELKNLKDRPLEGFRVKLVNDEDMFQWEVAIFGPPGTIYQGGYFKARMTFPYDYPYSPPSLKFEESTMLYHPNVYESGDLCISILHPPINDPQSGEHPSERWNPTQSISSILLSVVSLLNEPNTSSPANVDASVKYRKWIDTAQTDNPDKEYELLVKAQVAASIVEAEKDGVVVPITVEDYVVKMGPHSNSSTKSSSVEIGNLYDVYDEDEFLDEPNDPNSNSDESVGGRGSAEQEPGDQASTPNPTGATEAGGLQKMSLSPGNKNGAGKTFEEVKPSGSDNDHEKTERGVSPTKKPKLNSNSK